MVEHRREAVITRIFRYANHFHHVLLVAKLFRDVAAQRIASVKEGLGQRFINHADVRRSARVLLADVTSQQQRYADR